MKSLFIKRIVTRASIFVFVGVAISTSACLAQEVPSVDAEAVRAWLEEGKPFTVLDVRTPEEFEAGHPVGAINIPLMFSNPEGGRRMNENFLQEVQGALGEESTIVVICRTGVRSARATRTIREAGYNESYNFLSGFLGPGGWKSSGLPSDAACGSVAEKNTGMYPPGEVQFL